MILNKRLTFLIVSILVVSSYAFGQKIKYKDLYYLLNAKKYDEAEPFLKSFLSNPKEADHPNANFQMGIIYHEKFKLKDLLKETEDKLLFLDSAIIFYNKAKIYITEKEVKKHDEYYEEYYRRDLRTGKMGIKLSDVQLDIETRLESLKKDKGLIIELSELFDKTDRYYNISMDLYKNLVTEYSNQKQFYLRANKKTIEKLNEIKNTYDSAMGNFGRFKIVLGEFEHPGYDQILQNLDIENISSDGKELADFYANTVKVWNYDGWATSTINKINKDILPVQNALVSHDEELNKLYDKVKDDSVSVLNEVVGFNNLSFLNQLRPYSKKLFPEQLFMLKNKELSYLSENLKNLQYKDSVHIDNQLEIAKNSMQYILEMDSVINLIGSFDVLEESTNYNQLIENQYGGSEGLNSFIKEKKEFVSTIKTDLEAKLEQLNEESKWILFKSDSIPLFKYDLTHLADNQFGKKQYFYLGNKTISDTSRVAFGISYAAVMGVPKLYVTEVNSSHSIDELKEMNLDKTYFALDSVDHIDFMRTEDELKNTYLLIYSMNYFDKPTQAHLLKIKPDMSVSWEHPVVLLYPPDVLTISNDFGVLGINYDVKYIDKSKGLQLISRELFDSNNGEKMKD